MTHNMNTENIASALNWVRYGRAIDQSFNGACDCRVGLVGQDFGDIAWGATVKHPANPRASFKQFQDDQEAKDWALRESNAINQRHQPKSSDNS